MKMVTILVDLEAASCLGGRQSSIFKIHLKNFKNVLD
jgi:hypothetical protein